MKHSQNAISVSDQIKVEAVFSGFSRQDGAIYGDYLFHFDADGSCCVYSIKGQCQVSCFTLDKLDVLKPHCNTVCFGAEKFHPSDEYPLLYCNVYNNYANAEDRLEGVCCVYRLKRNDCEFTSELVQVIRIGFVEDRTLWKSLPDHGDIRPYGNFVPDAGNRRLHAYVLRDAEHVTRFFTFDLPVCSAGEYSDRYGVNVVTLKKTDIQAMFDCDYTDYIQGGCCYDGKLYSVAGVDIQALNAACPPRMQIVDMEEHRQLICIELAKFGLTIEPEMVDFDGDTLCYMDASGRLYHIRF